MYCYKLSWLTVADLSKPEWTLCPPRSKLACDLLSTGTTFRVLAVHRTISCVISSQLHKQVFFHWKWKGPTRTLKHNVEIAMLGHQNSDGGSGQCSSWKINQRSPLGNSFKPPGKTWSDNTVCFSQNNYTADH